MIYGIESTTGDYTPCILSFSENERIAKSEIVKELNDKYYMEGVFDTENSFDDYIYLFSGDGDRTPIKSYTVIDLSDLSDYYDYILSEIKKVHGDDFNGSSWQWEFKTDKGMPIHGNPIYTKKEFAQSLICQVASGFDI